VPNFFRAAQRAFRERKQSQLAELQARVQSYEQGEIERNVSLQNIAKLLKEENENLRHENLLLKEKVARMEREHEAPRENEMKRWRNDSPSSSVSSIHPATKKSKVSPESSSRRVLHLSPSRVSSPPSTVSSPNLDTHSSPLPLDSQSDQAQNASFSNFLEFSSNSKAGTFESGGIFPPFDCGFCNEHTPCVCRQIVLQHSADRIGVKNLKVEHYEQNNSIVSIGLIHPETAPGTTQTSILDCLPDYQPPIPLRRRSMSSNLNTIFRVAPPQPPSTSPASCSGDPANCMACADDSFGRAFCAAIGESIATTAPCIDCPRSHDIALNIGSSAPELPADHCRRDVTKGDCRPPSSTHTSSIPISSPMQLDSETIPTNDAWRQLKSHPNVEFTDLSLLADVVARRSKCTGPLLVVSSASGSILPEQADSSPSYDGVSRVTNPEHEPVLLTDPHAHHCERGLGLAKDPPPPPQLVPQEELMRCGRRWRVREVYAHAVRDALRLLDAKFSQS